MSDRQKPKSVPGKLHKGKETAIIGSGARGVIEELKKGNGWGEFGKMAGFEDGKIRLPGIRFAMLMKALGDLARPDNPSPFMIEYVRVGKTIFLHLTEKPPQEVLDAMAREGSGNYSSSNDISRLLEGIDDQVVAHGGESRNTSRNPYKAGDKYHTVFEMASDWIPFSILLSRIRDELCEGNMNNARSLLGLVAKRAGRSHLQNRKSADGVRMVRAVAGPT